MFSSAKRPTGMRSSLTDFSFSSSDIIESLKQIFH